MDKSQQVNALQLDVLNSKSHERKRRGTAACGGETQVSKAASMRNDSYGLTRWQEWVPLFHWPEVAIPHPVDSSCRSSTHRGASRGIRSDTWCRSRIRSRGCSRSALAPVRRRRAQDADTWDICAADPQDSSERRPANDIKVNFRMLIS